MEKVIDEAVLLRFKQKIVEDYTKFFDRYENREYAEKKIQEFTNSITFKLGNQYIKVFSGGSVHSFIVVSRDNPFPYGTLLKSASRHGPAKNFSRGSIFGDLSGVRWTGVIDADNRRKNAKIRWASL